MHFSSQTAVEIETIVRGAPETGSHSHRVDGQTDIEARRADRARNARICATSFGNEEQADRTATDSSISVGCVESVAWIASRKRREKQEKQSRS
jgi:hypothetical protein